MSISQALSVGAPNVQANIITGWPFTIFYWLRHSHTLAYQQFQYDVNATDYIWMRTNHATLNRLQVRDYAGSTDVLAGNSGENFENDVWTPVLIECDTAVTFYQADLEAADYTSKGTFQTPSTPTLYLLGDPSNYYNAPIYFAHFTIWNSILSVEDKQALFAGVRPIKIATANRQARWDFETNDGNFLIDAENSYTLTRPGTGATWNALHPDVFNIYISDIPDLIRDGSTGNSLTTVYNGTDITTLTFDDDTATYSLDVSASLSGTGGSYTFDYPDVSLYAVDTSGVPFSSPSYVYKANLDDGSDTGKTAVTLSPKTGWAVIEIITPDMGAGSLFSTWAEPPLAGDQILYPTDFNTSIDSAGHIFTDKSVGSIPYGYFDQGDTGGTWKQASIIIELTLPATLLPGRTLVQNRTGVTQRTLVTHRVRGL